MFRSEALQTQTFLFSSKHVAHVACSPELDQTANRKWIRSVTRGSTDFLGYCSLDGQNAVCAADFSWITRLYEILTYCSRHGPWVFQPDKAANLCSGCPLRISRETDRKTAPRGDLLITKNNPHISHNDAKIHPSEARKLMGGGVRARAGAKMHVVIDCFLPMMFCQIHTKLVTLQQFYRTKYLSIAVHQVQIEEQGIYWSKQAR